MKKLKVIKKIMKAPCWVCKGKKCKVCNFTGQWEESIRYFIYKDKTGQLVAFDSDNLS